MDTLGIMREKTEEGEEDTTDSFEDTKKVRRFLSSSTYGICCIHTLCFLFYFLRIFVPGFEASIKQMTYMWYINGVLFIVLVALTLCFGTVRYKCPFNILLLLALIISVSIFFIQVLYTFQLPLHEIVVFMVAFSASGQTCFFSYICARSLIWISLVGCVLFMAISYGILCIWNSPTKLANHLPFVIPFTLLYCVLINLNLCLMINGLHFYDIKSDEKIVPSYHLLYIDVVLCPVHIWYCINKK